MVVRVKNGKIKNKTQKFKKAAQQASHPAIGCLAGSYTIHLIALDYVCLYSIEIPYIMFTVHAKPTENTEHLIRKYKKKSNALRFPKRVKARKKYKTRGEKRKETLLKAIYTARYKREHGMV